MLRGKEFSLLALALGKKKRICFKCRVLAFVCLIALGIDKAANSRIQLIYKSLHKKSNMNSNNRSVKRQKISSSIGSGALEGHVCWTEAGEREEKLQLGNLLHQDVAYKSILRSALRDDQKTAHSEGREDILFEHKICLKLVNIST